MNEIPKNLSSLSQTIPALILSPNSFTNEEVIKKNETITYWHSKENKTGKDLFVKEYTTNPLTKKCEVQFAREVSIVNACNHRFILQLAGYTTEAPFSILSEYFPGKSLKHAMYTTNPTKAKSKKKIAFSGMHLTTIALSIAHAMMYLHEKLNILHGNLALKSIQLDSKQRPILTHFEDAFYDDADRPKTLRTVVFPSMAPEMVDSTIYNKKVDVYAFAFILFEMCEGYHPYEGMSEDEILALLTRETVNLKFSSSTTEPMKNMILRCCAKNPDDRPSFKEIFAEFTAGNLIIGKADQQRIMRIASKLEENYLAKEVIQATVQPGEIVLPEIPKNANLFDIAATRGIFDDSPKIEINKKLISNTSQPKFLDNFKMYGEKCNDNTAKEFYDATSQFLTPKNSRSIRIAAFNIYFQTMQHVKKLIDVSYDSQLYFNLPTTDDELIQCSLDLMASLFILRPTKVTTEILETLETFIKLRPCEMATLFAQFVRRLSPFQLYFPILNLFFDSYEVYAQNKNACPLFIRFWANVFQSNIVLLRSLEPKLKNVVSQLIKTDSLTILDETYCFIAILCDLLPGFEIDYEIIIKHLSLEEPIESIFSVLMRQKSLPVDKRLCNLLIKWAFDIDKAQTVLYQFTYQNEESALMVTSNKSWLVDGLSSEYGVYTILLMLYKHPKCISVVSQYEQLPNTLLKFILTNDAFTLATIGTLIDLSITDEKSFKRFEAVGVFVSFFQNAAQSVEKSVVISASDLIRSLSKYSFAYTQSYSIFLPVLYKMLGSQDETTPIAITAIVGLTSFKKIVPILYQYNLSEYFKSLLQLDEYKELATIYFRNMETAAQ